MPSLTQRENGTRALPGVRVHLSVRKHIQCHTQRHRKGPTPWGGHRQRACGHVVKKKTSVGLKKGTDQLPSAGLGPVGKMLRQSPDSRRPSHPRSSPSFPCSSRKGRHLWNAADQIFHFL